MKNLIKRQTLSRLNDLMALRRQVRGVKSWIQYVRKALGMTPGQLADRLGVAKSTLHQIERQEAQDKVTIQTLKRAAEALHCEFVYAFIPRKDLGEVIDEQAQKKVVHIMGGAQVHMELEDQAVEGVETKAQIEELKELIKESKQLWEKDS